MDCDLEDILPHRAPMVLIDALAHCHADGATAVKTFRRDAYGLEADGRVSEPVLIECLAQTFAAFEGSRRRERRSEPGQGLLVGVARFEFREPAWQDQPLHLTVRVTRRFGPFRLVEGCVRAGETILAQGELKCYLEARRA